MDASEIFVLWGYNKEINVGEGNQKLHRDCGKAFGSLTVFLKTDTEGSKTGSAANPFQYFMTRTENSPASKTALSL